MDLLAFEAFRFIRLSAMLFARVLLFCAPRIVCVVHVLADCCGFSRFSRCFG